VPKCGKTGTTIRLDNKDVTATEEGNYLYLDIIGSGEHHFER
jgi:alpha-L-rhamnosidase